MSSIDERIVSMKFNNGQFEKGIKTTLDSLSALKKGLSLEGAKKGLADVSSAAKNFDMSSMASSVDGISLKFAALATVSITALTNIANRAVDTGLQIAKSLTIAPVAEGYGDYERKLTSVQTVMNATGKSIEVVSGHFDELDSYADDTIYNLDDMTSALAKFVNAGVDLDKSVPAIRGIGNATAYAGQGAGEAQLAYRNFSDAISKGFMGGGDWLSLKNSNVVTKEFKDVMIATGIEMGTLKKTAKDTYTTLGQGAQKAGVSSAELFNVLGETQWADTNVLMGTLSKFGDTTTELGKKAQGSAQDVKSFGMMFETLSASVGTGWTDTFEILFGNVEEAKALFTPLTNVFAGMIDGITALRNNPLEAWKENGGREAMINGLKNAFEALGNVFGPIKQAFKEVFPPSSGATITALSKGFEKFTETLKMGGKASNAIKGIFVGVFSIINAGIEIVKGIARYFFDFVVILGQLAGGLTPIAGAIGEVLSKIQNWSTAGDGIKRFFDMVIAGRRQAMDPLIDFVGRLGAAFATLISGDFDGFVQQFKSSFEAFDPLVEKAKAALDRFKGAMAALGTGFENVKNLARSFFADSTAEAQKLYTGALTPLLEYVDRLKQAFNDLKTRMGIKASDVGGDMTSGMESSLNSVETVGDRVKDLWQKIADGFKSVASFLRPAVDGIVDVFTTVRDKIADFLKGLTFEDAVSLLNTGILVGLYMGIKKFVDNLNGLTVDIGKVVESIVGVFGQLTDTLKAMQQNLQAGTLMKIAIAVGLLAAATVALSFVDGGKLAKALGAIGALFAGLMGTMAMFTKLTPKGIAGLTSAASALVLLSIAVAILASAVERLAGLDWQGLAKGLIGVGGLLASLVLFTKFAEASKKGKNAAIGLIPLAIAISVLAFAVEKFGKMDVASLGKGLVTLGAVMAMMAGMTTVMDQTKGILKASKGMLILSAAILVLAFSLKALSMLSLEELGFGLLAISSSLTVIAGAMQAMPKNMEKNAQALLVVSGALLVLSGVMKVLSSLGLEGLLISVAALAGTLIIISMAMNNMVAALPGAKALTVVALALGMLAPVLLMFSLMGLEGIGLSLLMLAGVFTVLGVAGLVMGPVVPVLIALGIAMGIIGAAALMAGGGMLMFATGFAALAASGAAGTAVLVGIVVSLGALIPTIMEQVGMGIRAIAKVISGSGPEFVGAMTTLILSLTKAIRKTAPDVIDTLVVLVHKLLDVLVKNAPEFAEKGLLLITGMLNSIANNLGGVIEAGVNVVVAFLDGIGNAIPRILQAAIDLVLDFITGLTTAINDNHEEVNSAITDLVEAMINAFTDAIGNIASLGWDIVSGIASGIWEQAGDVVEAVRQMAIDALGIFADVLGIRSPSKEFAKMGVWVNKGFVKGLKGSDDEVQAAFDTMKGRLKDVMNDSKGDIKDLEEKLKTLTSARKQDAKAIEKTTAALERARSERAAASSAYETLTKKLRDEKNTLKELAKEYDDVAEKLDAARTKLADAKQTRDDYKTSIVDQYTSFGDITEETTLGLYVEDLQKQVDDTQAFASQLQNLRNMGLSDEMYKELLAKGPVALPFVNELAAGGIEAIQQVEFLRKQLVSAADNLGSTASLSMYQAGVDSAEGLVKGLKADLSSIDKQMERIAKRMVRILKKKLGIKSPSREFAKIGKFSTDGMIVGLDQSSKNLKMAAEDVGKTALEALQKTLSKVDTISASEIDVTPRIQPVLDLSSVKKEARRLDGMLAPSSLNVSASYQRAATISDNEQIKQLTLVAPPASPAVSETQLTFVQNITSPKAISAAEVYRNTKNQLSGALERLPI